MESNKEEKIKTVSEENIYKLNGRVPLKKPFRSAYSMYWRCSYRIWLRY